MTTRLDAGPMSIMELGERYIPILRQAAFSEDERALEESLIEAYRLGKLLTDHGATLDDIGQIHKHAVLGLTREYPDLRPEGLAERLSRPFIEMSTAFGVVTGKLMAQKYRTLIGARSVLSNKLETLGMLTVGIAHDFDNLLGDIIDFAKIAKDDLAEDSLGKRKVEKILKVGLGGRDLVGRMLAFARPDFMQSEIAEDWVGIIREVLILLSATFNCGLHFRFETGIRQAMVFAEPGQLQRIIMNLCLNAADASDLHGVVTINLAKVPPAENPLSGTREAVCLTVRDKGAGMAAEERAKIFDPFFSMTSPDECGGLSLSVVKGLADQLGGLIEVQSGILGNGRGTECKVYLPLVVEGRTDAEVSRGR